jgi:hypothetical protein
MRFRPFRVAIVALHNSLLCSQDLFTGSSEHA